MRTLPLEDLRSSVPLETRLGDISTRTPIEFINVPIVVNAPVTFNVLPNVFSDTLVSTTPTVLNLTLFKSHTGATTVTDFLGGAVGQTISILGNGNTTITHGTNIFTNTGANKVLAANIMYRFTFFEGKWYEHG